MRSLASLAGLICFSSGAVRQSRAFPSSGTGFFRMHPWRSKDDKLIHHVQSSRPERQPGRVTLFRFVRSSEVERLAGSHCVASSSVLSITKSS